MTAGLPGLRTVPSPLAPRLQAGADLHVHTTHSDGRLLSLRGGNRGGRRGAGGPGDHRP